MEQVANDVVEPPIGGLHFETILKPGSDDGIALVHVPESFGGPHRPTATAGKDIADRYYMRTGARSLRMPHALLADRFARHRQPKLRVVARFIHGGDGPTLNLWIRNVGSVAAVQPFLRLNRYPPWLRWHDSTPIREGFERRHARGAEEHGVQFASVPGFAVYAGADVSVYSAGPANGSGGQTIAIIYGEIHALNLGTPHSFSGSAAMNGEDFVG